MSHDGSDRASTTAEVARRWGTAGWPHVISTASTTRGVGWAWLATRASFAVGLVLAHLGSRPALLPDDVAVVYYNAASHLMHGGIPYLTFPYEYPPGTLPVLAAAWALGGSSPASFVIAWCLLMLALDGAVTWWLTRSRFGVRAGFVWIIGVCLLGPTIVLRNDLVVVATFVIAFGLTAREGTFRGGAMWMAGVLSKVWPLPPLVGLIALRRAGRGRMLAGAVCVLLGTAAALVATGALGAMITYLLNRQGQRPLEIETVWATPVWIKALVTDGHVAVVQSFGSENLRGGQLAADAATALTVAVEVGCVLAPLLIARRTCVPMGPSTLGWIFATYVSATVFAAPVASPQYAAWLLGAACVLVGVSDRADASRFAVLVLVACGLTQLIFPALFASLQNADPGAIVALLLRNTVLVGLVAAGVAGLAREIKRTAISGTSGSSGQHTLPT